eukprot:6303920-Amphidinium_carterae.1
MALGGRGSSKRTCHVISNQTKDCRLWVSSGSDKPTLCTGKTGTSLGVPQTAAAMRSLLGSEIVAVRVSSLCDKFVRYVSEQDDCFALAFLDDLGADPLGAVLTIDHALLSSTQDKKSTGHCSTTMR